MRKLASIQTVSQITPIHGADAIEVADILGWHVIVKKDELKVGEKVVYCEVDSILPERPEFEFLRERSKFRIKTIRLRGQVSQGICFPLLILPEGKYEIGDDVTEILGVTLYEPPETGDGIGQVVSTGAFPSYIVPKTDEERVQNRQKLLALNVGRRCYITEKLDGTSATYIYQDGESIAASRNLRVGLGEECTNAYAELTRKYSIFEKLAERGIDIAIQGEIVGPGIQKNKYKLKDKELFVFNVIETKTQKYYTIEEMKVFCEDMGLKTVPILDMSFALLDSVDEMVELSKGKSVLHDVVREGIVVRSTDGSRFSFKCLNPDFLLKYE